MTMSRKVHTVASYGDKSEYELLRENNIQEKKDKYFEVMGEKFPENETSMKKKIRSRTNKKPTETSTTETKRKSLRNRTVVNYKELSVNYKKRTVKENDITEQIDNVKLELQINKPKMEGNLVMICDVCKKQFNTIAELKNHIKNYHKRIFFNCPTCELPMYSKDSLEKHYKFKHSTNGK